MHAVFPMGRGAWGPPCSSKWPARGEAQSRASRGTSRRVAQVGDQRNRPSPTRHPEASPEACPEVRRRISTILPSEPPSVPQAAQHTVILRSPEGPLPHALPRLPPQPKPPNTPSSRASHVAAAPRMAQDGGVRARPPARQGLKAPGYPSRPWEGVRPLKGASDRPAPGSVLWEGGGRVCLRARPGTNEADGRPIARVPLQATRARGPTEGSRWDGRRGVQCGRDPSLRSG